MVGQRGGRERVAAAPSGAASGAVFGDSAIVCSRRVQE
jgi:hypothetical protein